ncbi:MAG: hypothetical protein V9G21_00890 [Methylotenera sp.]
MTSRPSTTRVGAAQSLAGVDRGQAGDQVGERGGQAVDEAAEVRELAGREVGDQRVAGDAVVREGTGEQLVQHEAERVEVGLLAERVALPQLGGHVERCAGEFVAAGRLDGGVAGLGREVENASHPGDPEVDQLGLAGAGEHDVGGLDVAVQHALAVHRGQAARESEADLEDRAPGQGGHHLGQADAVDVLGGDVRLALDLADAVDRGDVRVVHAGERAGLGEQARAALGALLGVAQELERDGPVEQRVVAEPHRTHAALTEQADQPEVVEDLARGDC